MFLELHVAGIARGDLGWILSKHPQSSYKNQYKAGRTVVGGWRAGDESKEVVYWLQVENDGVTFLEIMKKQNASSYVHMAPYAVCPFNLVPLRQAIKTPLSNIPNEQATRAGDAFDCRVLIGPWPLAGGVLGRLRTFAAAMGLTAELAATGEEDEALAEQTVAERQGRDESEERWGRAGAGAVLWLGGRLSVPGLLQRIYCLAWAFTARRDLRITYITTEHDTYKAATPWIAQMPERVQEAFGFNSATGLWKAEEKARLVEQAKDEKEELKEEANKEEKEEKEPAGKKAQKGKGGRKEGKGAELEEYQSNVDEELEAADQEEEEEEEEAAAAEVAETAAEAEGAEGKRGHDQGDRASLGGRTLHQRRHELIVAEVRAAVAAAGRQARLLDYGCGEMLVARALVAVLGPAELQITAVDTHLPSLRRGLRGLPRRRVTAVQADICAPGRLGVWAGAFDIVVSCEVIEHLELAQRQALVNILSKALRPRLLLLTTPNYEWNAIGLPDMATQYRHPDHRIEYTRAQYESEVLRPLAHAGYQLREVELVPGAAVQPSFILVASLPEGAPLPADAPGFLTNTLARLARREEPFFLPLTRHLVAGRHMKAAYTAEQFRAHYGAVFAAAPTIPPAEYSREAPGFLEHPAGALAYYRRLVPRLIAERKYMGSRVQIFVRRGQAVRVQSRNGNAFFRPNDPLHAALAEELLARLPSAWDFAILDEGEFLPWALKAGELIRTQFLGPGRCALADRLFAAAGHEQEPVARARHFLAALANYSQSHEPYVRVFNVLAAGRARGHLLEAQLMGDYVPAEERLAAIAQLCGDSQLLRPVEALLVDLADAASCEAATAAWLDYCEAGGEGFVFKPANAPRCFDRAGLPVLPAMKVRGRPYLRLIYGLDYLEPAFFARLTARQIGRKRRLAHLQAEAADLLLRAVLAGEPELAQRCSAAFYAVDNVQIDATL